MATRGDREKRPFSSGHTERAWKTLVYPFSYITPSLPARQQVSVCRKAKFWRIHLYVVTLLYSITVQAGKSKFELKTSMPSLSVCILPQLSNQQITYHNECPISSSFLFFYYYYLKTLSGKKPVLSWCHWYLQQPTFWSKILKDYKYGSCKRIYYTQWMCACVCSVILKCLSQ